MVMEINIVFISRCTIELGEKGNRLNDRAIRELKDFLYFQLIFPHEGEK